jgi:hypothetical protein
MHRAVFIGLQVDAHTGAKPSAVLDDDLADWLANTVVFGKRLFDVFAVMKGLCERLRVAACFRDAETHMGTRVRRGITDQHHAVRVDTRRDEIVDRREEGLIDRAQALVQHSRQCIICFFPQRGHKQLVGNVCFFDDRASLRSQAVEHLERAGRISGTAGRNLLDAVVAGRAVTRAARFPASMLPNAETAYG